MAKGRMFRLTYGPWHRFDSNNGKALCGVEPAKRPGSGTKWATAEVRPIPKCSTCHEMEITRGLRDDDE